MSSTQDVRFSEGAARGGPQAREQALERLAAAAASTGAEPDARPRDARGALDPRAARRDAGRARGRVGGVRLLASACRRSTTSRSTTSATGTPRRSSRGSARATRTPPRPRSPRSSGCSTLLHPVMPHVTEEIWSQFHDDAPDRLAVAGAGRRATPPTPTRSSASRRRPRSSGAAASSSSSRATSSGSSTPSCARSGRR